MSTDNNTFDAMLQQFKDYGSLQQFAESQHRTINELTKKVSELRDEVAHLKSLLDNTVPLFGTPNISNEELICLKQIEDLKRESDSRTLTLDETRRLDMLVKNLHAVRANVKKESKLPFTDTSSAELIDLLKESKE